MTTTLYPIYEAADGTVAKETTPDYNRYHAYGPHGEYLGWARTYFGAVAYLNQP